MNQLLSTVVFLGLAACCAMCFYRIARGPTPPDRVVAIDILGIVVVCFAALFGIFTDRDYYINVGIAWAILSFIATIALAKHLEGKGFDE